MSGQSRDTSCRVGSNAGGFAIPEDPDAEMTRLLDLSHARLEYPEVSFTRIGDIITTAMGVSLNYSPPTVSVTDGGWVELTVETISGNAASQDMVYRQLLGSWARGDRRVANAA
jgi:hypothetical protein